MGSLATGAIYTRENPEMQKMLSGADAKERANEAWTPLHSAAQNGHLEVVNRLLEVSVDSKERSSNGYTPLDSAARNGHLEVINQLLEAADAKGVQLMVGRIYSSRRGMVTFR